MAQMTAARSETPTEQRSAEDRARGVRGGPTASPLYFGDGEARLFGWYYSTPGAPARRAGVVLACPLGHAYLRSYRAYRSLALRLAREGFAVLWFEYHGTGNSAGADDEPDRIGTWCQNVGSAVDALKARAGVDVASIVGLRLGATFSCIAAAGRDDVEGLVLWSPCIEGRAYTREVELYGMLAKADPTKATQAQGDGDGDGAELAGLSVSSETLADLGGLSLLALDEAPCARSLVIGNGEVPVEQSLVTHLSSLGVGVTHAHIPGGSCLAGDAKKGSVPEEVLDTIVNWLCALHPDKGAPFPQLDTRPIELRGEAFSETPVFVSEKGGLYGILTEPLASDAEPRPIIVLMNAGAAHDVGAHRMHVAMARRWAKLGFSVFRYGLSPTSPGDSAGDRPEALRDVLRSLGVLRPGRPLALVGLCTGARLAFEVAGGLNNVSDLVMVNPITLHGDPEGGERRRLEEARAYRYREMLLSPRGWKHILARNVDGRRAVRALVRMTVGLSMRAVQRISGKTTRRREPIYDVPGVIQGLTSRGVHVLLVYSQREVGYYYMNLNYGDRLRAMEGTPRFRIELIDSSDHGFLRSSSRLELFDLLHRHWAERYPGAAPSPGQAEARRS